MKAFDRYAEDYDHWYDKHLFVYRSEVRAIKAALPKGGRGVEIGVGTGRFSSALGITVGVEPSAGMARLARQRGIDVYSATAKKLPFMDSSYGFALFAATLCFVSRPLTALKEARRILKPGGRLVIGLIDSNTRLGREYWRKNKSGRFYEGARFYSVARILGWLKTLGFSSFNVSQTIFTAPDKVKELEPVRVGHGEGLFVVISAVKRRLK